MRPRSQRARGRRPGPPRARAPVVVIGGGAAGITAAAALRRAGVPSLVLDRGDRVGDSWTSRYDRLRLNTSTLTSRVAGTPFPRGTRLFPSRDEFAGYLELCAERHRVDLALRTEVERIDRTPTGWRAQTSGGELETGQVIVATGYACEPRVPDWPRRRRFGRPLLHSADYRNPGRFAGQDVLVVGSGSSGMEIAHDLATGGAARVRLAVRTPPNIVPRAVAGVPGDPVAVAMLKLPPAVGDAQLRILRRLTIGDLTPHGLPRPAEGPFARARRDGAAPAVVDAEVIAAIRDCRVEIVPGVEQLDATGVELAGGGRVEPDAVIAATGYRCALEPLVGHLGVLDGRGVPSTVGGEEAAPGLRFIGFVPLPGLIRRTGVEAARAARALGGGAA